MKIITCIFCGLEQVTSGKFCIDCASPLSIDPNTDIFVRLTRAFRLTPKFLAQHLEITKQSVSQKLSGRRKVKDSELSHLYRILSAELSDNFKILANAHRRLKGDHQD